MSTETTLDPAAEERFWEKVNKDGPGGCWVWTGGKIEGYGRFNVVVGHRRYKYMRAHRLAYELLVRPIPDGLTLDHLCRVRDCVNPQHLEPVSSGENALRAPEGVAAINARKTHCKYGHPLSGDNLRIRPEGRRECRACRREIERRKRQEGKRK